MNRNVSIHTESWLSIIPFRIANNVWDDFPCVICEIEQDGLVAGRHDLRQVGVLDHLRHELRGRLVNLQKQFGMRRVTQHLK